MFWTEQMFQYHICNKGKLNFHFKLLTKDTVGIVRDSELFSKAAVGPTYETFIKST